MFSEKSLLTLFIAQIFIVAGCAHAPSAQDLPGVRGLHVPLAECYGAVERKPFEPQLMQTFRKPGSDDVLKILIFTELSGAEAREKMADRTQEVERLFQRSVEPYFGKVHDDSACRPLVKALADDPKEDADSINKKIGLRATEQFVLRACEDSDDFYFAQITFLFCKKSKSLFEIRDFSKVKTSLESDNGFRCSP